MSMRTLEREILAGAKEVLRNPTLKMVDITEWSTSEEEVKSRAKSEEVVFRVEGGLGIWCAVFKFNDRRPTPPAPVNPWLLNGDVLNQKTHPGIQTCDGADRIHKIGECQAIKADMEWLRRVIAWPENQKTVQQAAERKMRRLEKELGAAIAAGRD